MSNSAGPPRVYPRGAMLLSSSVLTPQRESQERSEANPEIAASSPSGETPHEPAQVQTHVLVVEDERIVGLHLKQQLVKLGYRVVAVVSSGEEALRAVTERQPDLVLMDIHIDGAIDGIETARRISAKDSTPVIYLTAFAGEDTLRRAAETKPYGYVMKPFSERELHATIQMALERCRADQEARHREDRLLIALGLANGRRAWC